MKTEDAVNQKTWRSGVISFHNNTDSHSLLRGEHGVLLSWLFLLLQKDGRQFMLKKQDSAISQQKIANHF